MVSVANSPHVVRGKTAREPGKEVKPKPKPTGKAIQNGGVPHLVLVKTPHPRPSSAVNATPSSSPPLPAPAPRNHRPPPAVATTTTTTSSADTGRGEPAAVRTSIRTRGQPTGTEGAETMSCNDTREEGEPSVCPQAALSYTSTILTSRADRVLSRQQTLDERLRRLHSRVRGRQERGVCRHVQSQLSYTAVAAKVKEEGRKEGGGEGRAAISRAASIPMQVDGAVEDVCVDRVSVARSLKFGSCDNSDQSKRSASPTIDDNIIGDSTEQISYQQKQEVSIDRNSPPNNTRDWPAVDKFLQNRSGGFSGSASLSLSDGGRNEIVDRWQQQLRGACVGPGGGGGGEVGEAAGNGEITDTSSDEEGEPVCSSARQKR